MIRLTKTYHINTKRERDRIWNQFKEDPETCDKLNELLDAIEACDWNKCHELLVSEWWQGRDKEQECPRLEFIGVVHTIPECMFPWHYSYLDLIEEMLTLPNVVCEPNVTVEKK